MEDPAVTNALYWLSWMPLVKNVAAALVAIGVVMEFGEGWISEPWQKIVDDARELRISTLNNEAEKLRNQNLELERAVSPRVLEQGLTAKQLADFEGVTFVVISPTDFEPKRTASQIRWMLDRAKWVRFKKRTKLAPFSFFDGVSIHMMGPPSKSGDPAYDAADALAKVLNDNGITARKSFPLSSFVGDDGKPQQFDPADPVVIVVEVGPKPLPASLQIKPESIPADDGQNRLYGNMAD